MPLYEYQCDACGHRFEIIQKFADSAIEVCPACGGPVRKLPSSPAIQFKGSGWYITDYARKGGDGAKGKDAPPSTGGDSAPAKPGSESKPSSAPATNPSKSD